MSLLTSVTTSYAMGVIVRDEVVLGVERRRRWRDEQKLEILDEVGRNGWTVADVARHHDIPRQQIYQWRQQLKRKGLWSVEASPMFLEVPSPDELPASWSPARDDDAVAPEVRIVLRSGRELHCGPDIDEAALRRLVHVLEAA